MDADTGAVVDESSSSGAELSPGQQMRAWMESGEALDDAGADAGTPARSTGADSSSDEADYWRERAARYEPMHAALQGLDADHADAFVELMRLTASDPERARRELARAYGIDLDEPFSLDELPGMIDEALAAREGAAAWERDVAASTQSIHATARDVGLEPGSDEYARVLAVVSRLRDEGRVSDPREAIRRVAAARSAGARQEPVVETRWDSMRAMRASLGS